MNNLQLDTNSISPASMADKALKTMIDKSFKSRKKVLLFAIMAGLFIGLGFVYCVIANVTGAGKIVGGLVFSLGLMLTIVMGADLFTSTTMTAIAVANRQVTLCKMLSNWGLVYSGNFIGAMILVGVILMSGHPFSSGGEIGLYYISTSMNKLGHTFLEAVGLGILCNIMVCLGVWMSFGARSLTDRMVAVLFPVGLFIAAGFEHSVANMFMVPAGIYSFSLATPEMLANIPDVEWVRETLTWSNFLLHNLLPVTIGNIIGGTFFIGLYQWLIFFKLKE